MLCTQVLKRLDGSLRALTFSAGKEFDLLVVSFDPGETPALGADQGRLPHRYIAGRREAAAPFLTGRAGVDRSPRRRGRFPLRLRRGDRSVRPSGGDHGADADGRVSRYLYGIEFAPGPAPGLVEASEGRIGTLVDTLLLFCYHYDPETGKLRHGDHEPRPAGRRADVVGLAGSSLSRCGERRRASSRAARRPIDVETSFPLFPPARPRSRPRWTCSTCSSWPSARSSRSSSRRWWSSSRIKYRRRHPDEVGHDIHGSLALELTWTIIPLILSMVMFGWGADLFYRLARPPRGLDGDLRRRQAVDVEGSAPRRRPRDQRAARADRTATVRLTMGSEDVLHDFLDPGVPGEDGRRPRQAHDDVVPGDETGHVPPVLCRILRTKHSG